VSQGGLETFAAFFWCFFCFFMFLYYCLNIKTHVFMVFFWRRPSKGGYVFVPWCDDAAMAPRCGPWRGCDTRGAAGAARRAGLILLLNSTSAPGAARRVGLILLLSSTRVG